VTGDISIREGSREDYRRLSHLHYRDSGLPVPREIYAMERVGELLGVIVYSYPPIRASGRKEAVGYSPDIGELNESWAIISRVIVHPKYRTIGLGSYLVQESGDHQQGHRPPEVQDHRPRQLSGTGIIG
jgi:GNAT superfamily N-acetyltransferase